jgi:hypothetical protein
MDNKNNSVSLAELSLFSKKEKARFYSNGELPLWLVDSRKERTAQTPLKAITGKKTVKGRLEIWLKNEYTKNIIIGVILIILSIIFHHYGLL